MDAIAADAALGEADLSEISVDGDGPHPWTTFGQCAFSAEVKMALVRQGFVAPTPIQAAAWPAASAGRDIIAVARTGSGKTLAYLVPAFHALQERRALSAGPRMVVLAPTRELAQQIGAEAEKLGGALRVRSAVCVGGATNPRWQQLKEIAGGVHLLVGTPGRIGDLLQTRRFTFKWVSSVVLDEADRMLDKGFEEQVLELVRQAPDTRQTVMFTATWSDAVQRVADGLIKQPVRISVGSPTGSCNACVEQEFIPCRSERAKEDTLVRLLRDSLDRGERVIVFVNTKAGCDALSDALVRRRVAGCAVLHGDLQQQERETAMATFRDRQGCVLLATDVAARGLDIKGVDLVVCFDIATTADTHVHRIGRTGRAGAAGRAVTLVNPGCRREMVVAGAVAVRMRDVGPAAPPDVLDGAQVAHWEEPEDVSALSQLGSLWTHNTGQTNLDVQLEGHQLARILASDKLMVEETVRRGFRFLNIEISKAKDDRFRRPKWRARRVVPWSEVEAAAGRHPGGESALGALRKELGEEPAGIVHAVLHDLYRPESYMPTEMFELPQENFWEVYDRLLEVLLEDEDDAQFLQQMVQDGAFQAKLRHDWEQGDTEEEYYWQTFSKLSFPTLKGLPLLHFCCEMGYTACLRVLLASYSTQTAPEPWMRLADVEWREKEYGNTPFHICAYNGDSECLQVLVEHAVKHSIPVSYLRTTQGHTALELADARKQFTCYRMLAPLFPEARPVPAVDDAQARVPIMVVDGPGGEEQRMTVDLPAKTTMRELLECLCEAEHQLGVPARLVLIKHVHIAGSPDTAEATMQFMRHLVQAESVTAYRCTSDSLQVSCSVMRSMAQIYQEQVPAWTRVFLLPALRGRSETEEEKQEMNAAAVELRTQAHRRGGRGELLLADFGRDGSGKFCFPRRYFARPEEADMLQGLLHVNTFLQLRRKLEQKFAQQTGEVLKHSKRSRSGRKVSQEDLRQPFFFVVKWGLLDRFYFRLDEVNAGITAKSRPADALRRGVDGAAFLAVACFYLEAWLQPLLLEAPPGLADCLADYLGALDQGLWALLGHHRLVPDIPGIVEEALEPLPAEHRSELRMTDEWLAAHASGEQRVAALPAAAAGA